MIFIVLLRLPRHLYIIRLKWYARAAIDYLLVDMAASPIARVEHRLMACRRYLNDIASMSRTGRHHYGDDAPPLMARRSIARI